MSIISSVFFLLGLLSFKDVKSNINYNVKINYTAKVNHIYNSNSEWKRIELKLLNHKSSPSKLLLIAKSFNFNNSDIISLDLIINKISNKGNPGEFDVENYYRSKDIIGISFYDNTNNSIDLIQHYRKSGFNYFINRIRSNLIQIIDSNLNSNNSALAKALILGDKTSLDKSIKQDFSNTGAMHVLAVSGLHVGILLSIILYVLALFSKYLNKKQAYFIAILFLWFYALITGFSASILRATFMFSILVFSKVFSKSNNSINTLCFTAFILLLINPNYLYDIGFQLSYLAMLGIFIFYKIIYSKFTFKFRFINILWQGTSVGLSAQLFTFPLTIFYFHQFPNYFILTNLGLIMITGIILSIGVLSIVFSKVIYLNKLFFILFSFVLILLLKFISSISNLPYSVAYGFNLTFYEVSFLYLIILVVFLLLSANKSIGYVLPFVLFTLVYIEYKRFQNLNCSEIVFFNSKKSLFVVKDGLNSKCFYSGDIKNAKYIMNSYLKIKPSKVSFQNINKYDEIDVSNKNININIRNLSNYTLVNINDEKYFLGESVNKQELDKFENYTLILNKNTSNLPVIKFINYLEDGAVFYDIKKSDQIDRI